MANDMDKFLEKEVISKLGKASKPIKPKIFDRKPDIFDKPKKNYLYTGKGQNRFKLEIRDYNKSPNKTKITKMVIFGAVMFLAFIILYLLYMNIVYENSLATYNINQSGAGYEITTEGRASDIALKSFGDSSYYVATKIPRGAKVLRMSVLGTDYYVPDIKVTGGIEYRPTATLNVVNQTLRGDHVIYTYIENEQLQWTFSFKDLNRYSGSDEINIKVFDMSNELLLQEKVEDDGNSNNASETGVIRTKTIRLKNLQKGVYKITLDTTGDTLITELNTIQDKFVFKRNVFLADSFEYNVLEKEGIIYTEEPINVTTYHRLSVQDIESKENVYKLSAPGQSVYINETGIIKFPKSDVIISSEGNIATNKKHYFNVLEWHNIASNIEGSYASINLAEKGNTFYYVDIEQLSDNEDLELILNFKSDTLAKLELEFLRKAKK